MKQFLSTSFAICIIVLANAKHEKRLEIWKETHLYEAALMYKSKFICGATLINETSFLTSAKCAIRIITVKDASVILGTDDLKSKDGVEYKVKEVTVHKNYNKSYELSHDIAMIHVNKKIIFNNKIQPVSVPESKINRDCFCGEAVFTSWGTTNINSKNASLKLQQTKLRVVDLKQCSRNWKLKKSRMIKTTHLCVNNEDSSSTLVANDNSGGPLVYNNVLIGILSFPGKGLPHVFTKITEYVNWIKDFHEEEEWANCSITFYYECV